MIRILGFGNSLTAGTPGYDPEYGWGDSKSQYGYWLMKLAEKDGWSNLSFDNQGVPGELARWMPARLKQILQTSKFSYAIILGGSNDIGWQDTPEVIILYLENLWLIAQEYGIKIIACTIPPIGSLYPPIQSAQSKLNALISSKGKDFDNVDVVDLFASLSDSEGVLRSDYDSGDGLHLNIQGYRRMGELIWKDGLKPLL